MWVTLPKVASPAAPPRGKDLDELPLECHHLIHQLGLMHALHAHKVSSCRLRYLFLSRTPLARARTDSVLTPIPLCKALHAALYPSLNLHKVQDIELMDVPNEDYVSIISGMEVNAAAMHDLGTNAK